MLFRILNAAAADGIEIAVYDIIGKNFFGEGIGEADVLAALNAKPKAPSITVRVSSIGGILDTAKTILNLFAERAAQGTRVEFRVESLAASAAAFLLTVPGARVVVAKNAFVMIHKAHGAMRGTDADMQAAAERLRAENQILVEAFAAASARRGKGKTAADFQAAIANNADRYFSAVEAVEWGIADAVTDASMQVAACAVDISTLADVPELVRQAPYARLEPPSVPALPPPVLAQAELPFAASTTIPPAPSRESTTNQQTPPPKGAEGASQTEKHMSKKILVALALAEDAGEEAALVAVNKLKTSAALVPELEKVLGVTGGELLGAVKALKETQARNDKLEQDMQGVKITLSRQSFETARDQGIKDRKLTPATAKHYTDRFEAMVKPDDNGIITNDGSSLVTELQGFLKVAPRILPATGLRPPTSPEEQPVAMQHDGKSFEQMKPMEQSRLKKANPELYNTMREDAVARGAL